MIPVSTDSKQDYCTPRWYFRWKDASHGFTLDAAARADNALCETYYTERRSGLHNPWNPSTFCNPPFWRIIPWVEKALTECHNGNSSLLLLPNSVAASWFAKYHRYCLTELYTPRFPYQGAPKEVPFGSMAMIFNPKYLEPGYFKSLQRIRSVDIRKPMEAYA